MQDRKNYASGNTITTEGFRCSIGEPIDIKVTVGESEEVYLFYINSGDYLVTLEVNGEKAAYRDLYHVGEDEVTIGNYTISDDQYLTGVSEGDEVVMRLEPVELTVTDAFRAAVGKVAPKSKGGSGGGVLVVGVTASGELGNVYTLDKTWKEILDADYAVAVMSGSEEEKTYGTILYTYYNVPLNKYSVGVDGIFADAVDFETNSASGYPTYTDE